MALVVEFYGIFLVLQLTLSARTQLTKTMSVVKFSVSLRIKSQKWRHSCIYIVNFEQMRVLSLKLIDVLIIINSDALSILNQMYIFLDVLSHSQLFLSYIEAVFQANKTKKIKKYCIFHEKWRIKFNLRLAVRAFQSKLINTNRKQGQNFLKEMIPTGKKMFKVNLEILAK